VSHHPPVFNFDMPGVDPSSVEAFRAYKRSMMLHRRLMMASFAGEEMHPAQAGCLQALSHHDGMSQSDLAEMLHVSRPTVTTMLQRMESAGVIERRDDASDSRVTRVYLTSEGRRLDEHTRTVLADMLNVSLGQLTAEDRGELTRLLNVMNAKIEAALVERGVSASGHPHGPDTEVL